jgi:hypothetical protein
VDRIATTMHADAPENELDVLRQLVATLQAALAESQKENTLLRQKIDALVRRVFGASSERIDRPNSNSWRRAIMKGVHF